MNKLKKSLAFLLFLVFPLKIQGMQWLPARHNDKLISLVTKESNQAQAFLKVPLSKLQQFTTCRNTILEPRNISAPKKNSFSITREMLTIIQKLNGFNIHISYSLKELIDLIEKADYLNNQEMLTQLIDLIIQQIFFSKEGLIKLLKDLDNLSLIEKLMELPDLKRIFNDKINEHVISSSSNSYSLDKDTLYEMKNYLIENQSFGKLLLFLSRINKTFSIDINSISFPTMNLYNAIKEALTAKLRQPKMAALCLKNTKYFQGIIKEGVGSWISGYELVGEKLLLEREYELWEPQNALLSPSSVQDIKTDDDYIQHQSTPTTIFIDKKATRVNRFFTEKDTTFYTNESEDTLFIAYDEYKSNTLMLKEIHFLKKITNVFLNNSAEILHIEFDDQSMEIFLMPWNRLSKEIAFSAALETIVLYYDYKNKIPTACKSPPRLWEINTYFNRDGVEVRSGIVLIDGTCILKRKMPESFYSSLVNFSFLKAS